MYIGSTEFNNLIEKSGGNALITRFKFSNFSIEKFTKLEYYGGSNSSDDIAIGTTNMAYLDVSTITDKIITNQEFLFEVGMKLSDGTVEYAPIGYFKVQKPDENEDTVDFTAYDRMHRFEKPYVSSLAYPTDSEKVLNELCTMCGVKLATPIASPITITDKLGGYTCREILGYIAGIHGFFACFDRYGQLNLRWYSETPIEKQIGLIWSLTKSQSNYTVEKITLAKDTETTYTSGTGISGINHSNPYATQAIADSIYANLGGFSYRPCEISMLDDIRLDPWDMLKVTYLDGSVLTIPVMSLSHSFTSGETRVKSVGKTNTENEYGYAGPVTQAMDRMTTELLVANRIIATKVDAEWVKANTLSADSAVIVDLKTNVAKIDTLIFGSASGTTIQTEFSNAVIAQLGEAQIKSAMIESVSASKIMAGEIYTNLVKIYGDSNKRLVIADNTIQLSDDSDVVRMQVGEDSFGQYNIIICNSDEEVIFDAVGVTEKGYHDGSIKNIAVADNANIGAEKLNIDSLFNVINNDGSHTLKSSKIYLDSEAQTLDISFKTMQTNVSALSTDVSTQGTQISLIQGQISSKIWQSDITTAVNNVQIGGRNLYYLYDIDCRQLHHVASYSVEDGEITLVANGNDLYIGEVLAAGGKWGPKFGPLMDIEGASYVTINISNSLFNKNFYNFLDADKKALSIYTYWNISSGRITVPSGAKYLNLRVGYGAAVSGTTYKLRIKVEKGNKATDWSPAPEDINDDILALTTQYSTLEQTLSGFKLEVGTTYATKDSLNSYATTASLDLYIKKDPTSGELKSAIEAIADTINITARGGLNLSGNRFTLTSTNTTITADGTITCNNLSATNATLTGSLKTNTASVTCSDGKTYSMQGTFQGGELKIANLTNGSNFAIQGHGMFATNSSGITTLKLISDSSTGEYDGLTITGQAGTEVSVLRDSICLWYQPNNQKYTKIGKGYVRICSNGTNYYDDCALSVIGGIKTDALNIFDSSIGGWCGAALNRTPENDISFSWDGENLRIHIDNTIIATYEWGSGSWI